MSKLAEKTKLILERHIKKGSCLELFPGDDHESINLLHKLTQNTIVAIGDYYNNAKNLLFIKQKVPPYPEFQEQFDYIYLNEAEWLVYAEFGGPVNFSHEPTKAIAFILDSLKPQGMCIISKVHHAVASIIFSWLSKHADFTFKMEDNVALFTRK